MSKEKVVDVTEITSGPAVDRLSIRSGKVWKFLVEIKIYDTSMSIGDVVKFIDYRLNLRNGAELLNVCLLDREVTDEVSNAT